MTIHTPLLKKGHCVQISWVKEPTWVKGDGEVVWFPCDRCRARGVPLIYIDTCAGGSADEPLMICSHCLSAVMVNIKTLEGK